MIPPLTKTTGAAAPAPAPAKAATFANGDFETFLKMLTTQIQNQDPMNPMEGSDFAVQLATFSGVEQQVRTNDLLKGVTAALGGGGLSQYAPWIGREVRTTAPVQFRDQPLTLDVAPDIRADRVVLVARDAQGREVSRDAIGRGAGEIDWFGRDAAGNKLADGRYSFVIEQHQGETRLADAPVGAYGMVVEARIEASGPTLVLAGGSTVPAGTVSALRGL